MAQRAVAAGAGGQARRAPRRDRARDVAQIEEWDETANYKGSDYIGKVGLELSYERELHGTTGVEEVEVDAAGRAVRTLSRTPPIAALLSPCPEALLRSITRTFSPSCARKQAVGFPTLPEPPTMTS
jgi:hypothetical protein